MPGDEEDNLNLPPYAKTLSAMVMINFWATGQDEELEKDLQNPRLDEMIVEATTVIYEPTMQEEWVKLVEGDGTDERRLKLAEKCRERIQEHIKNY